MSEIRSPQSDAPADAAPLFPLVAAQAGARYRIHSLGDNFEHRLELLAAGLAPDQEINVLSVCGRRHCVVACGQIRAAIGADLARVITLCACKGCPDAAAQEVGS